MKLKEKKDKKMQKLETTSFISNQPGSQQTIKNISLAAPLVENEDSVTSQDNTTEVYNLKSINLEIKKGELVAIIGKSGNGKSSLLQSIAEEMYQSSDSTIKINGSITIVDQ